MSNDLISREEFKKNIAVHDDRDIIAHNGRLFIAVEIVGGALEKTSTVDAEPVVPAQWEICEVPNNVDTYGNPDKNAHCTHCGFIWTDVYSVRNYFKRCPNCGATMTVKEG